MSQLASADTPRLGERHAQDRLGDDLRPDAKVLAEGPGRHAPRGEELLPVDRCPERDGDRRSAEQGNGPPDSGPHRTPDDLAVGVASGQVVMPDNIEANYAASMLEWVRQTFDGHDAVWVSDWGTNTILRFDPKAEKFESFTLSDSYASVRQLAGRRGEVWGAESASDKLFVLRSD